MVSTQSHQCFLHFTTTVVSLLKLLPFLLLISFQIYFILHGTGNFESDPEGDEEYKVFYDNRVEEINALGPTSRKHIFEFLEEEVFGVRRKQATAEQRRQQEFSDSQLQAIRAQAAREEEEEEDIGDEQGKGDQPNEGSQQGKEGQENEVGGGK